MAKDPTAEVVLTAKDPVQGWPRSGPRRFSAQDARLAELNPVTAAAAINAAFGKAAVEIVVWASGIR